MKTKKDILIEQILNLFPEDFNPNEPTIEQERMLLIGNEIVKLKKTQEKIIKIGSEGEKPANKSTK